MPGDEGDGALCMPGDGSLCMPGDGGDRALCMPDECSSTEPYLKLGLEMWAMIRWVTAQFWILICTAERS